MNTIKNKAIWNITKMFLGKIRRSLETFGRAIIVPVSIIPLLALIGAIGYAMQSISLHFNTYTGTLKTVADAIKDIGMIAITNIDFLIAVGLAAGLAKEEKLAAGLSGLLSLAALYFSSSFMIGLLNPTWLKQPQMYGLITRFGKIGFNYNAFGGMIAGLIGYVIHKYTYRIKFPMWLSFFGGPRFSPVAATLVAWLLGMLLALIWIPISAGLVSVGKSWAAMGAGGPFLYGFTNRLLIPFGLHQVVNYFLYYTAVGAVYQNVAGVEIQGIYNVALAKLGDGLLITAKDTWIVNGTFPTNMFALPAAALAMYFMIPKQNRKVAGSVLIAAALSSFLAGVTEPIEFSFLFASPCLYLIHTIFTGITYLTMYLAGFAQISTRGSGIVTWIVVNALNVTRIERVWGLFIVGPCVAGLYFGTFYGMIKYFDFKTPGREGKAVTLPTKKEALKQDNTNNGNGLLPLSQAEMIIKAYGGVENILTFANCISRLRVVVKDKTLFNEELAKAAGAFGFKYNETEIHSIFGPKVVNIASDVKKILEIKD
ncbi:PTS transporter subunit EIIC [Spiroplasma sp. SV19]|uniref:PTS transporter subunit EIIC n=1 Tax=Spiroplasma sp. SV19 TaxID=2570468 RepID=UPI0024B706CE|nr:PTS transporter subunit EIIC [Spiroplasma sp. SV19]WHQ36581.1 PTS sugar transporter subunit IIC [Spiroplasma sp. SV19]